MLQSVKSLLTRWFVTALSGMALGLFASLIIGLIISQLAQIPLLGFMAPYAEVLSASSPVIGAAIGVAVAYSLKASPLVIFSCAAVGAIGYIDGGPVGCYVASLFGAEIGQIAYEYIKKIRLEILVVPFVTIISGGLISGLIGGYVSAFMTSLGNFINVATEMQPLPMGIIVAVTVGMALTAPISSAALCIMLGLSGPAAGAALVGCCANMVGFAVMSYRDNGIGGAVAVGLGTSMLQVPNIVKKPIIWLPPIIASAILGPIATTILPMTTNAVGAGMGTSGLVGPINTLIVMGEAGYSTVYTMLTVLLLQFLLPALVTFAVYRLFIKLQFIKKGDLKLQE